MSVKVKQLWDTAGKYYPLTHPDAIRDENGNSLTSIIANSIAPLDVIEVAEEGLYFVDEQLNIGAAINDNGVIAPNILNYTIQ